MADHADDGNDVFVYMGGNQRVPRNVRYVRIHESVKIIPRSAFRSRQNLVSIEMHDGVEIIEERAFCECPSLRNIKLTGVRVIEEQAFWGCRALTDVEFGNKLETIGGRAFVRTDLRTIKIPKVRNIEHYAFYGCGQLTEVKLPEGLEGIGDWAFTECPRLRRIAFPLKDNLLGHDVFFDCGNLSQVDLVEGTHKTISSLLHNSWRNEMKDEIDRINQDLPYAGGYGKTRAIREWMRSVLQRITHYKLEHYTLLKEFTTLLELALWKAKLDESQEDERSLGMDQPAKKAKIDLKAARQEKRITSGANIVIKNVLPFLKLE